MDSDAHSTPGIMRPFVIDNVRRQDDVITDPEIPVACYDACSKLSLSIYLLALSSGLRGILLY